MRKEIIGVDYFLLKHFIPIEDSFGHLPTLIPIFNTTRTVKILEQRKGYAKIALGYKESSLIPRAKESCVNWSACLEAWILLLTGRSGVSNELECIHNKGNADIYELTWKPKSALSRVLSRILQGRDKSAIINEYLNFQIETASRYKELQRAKENVKEGQHLLSNLREENLALTAEAALAQLAHQVAHDIRSPIAALQVIEQDLSELPENSKILLQSAILRIKDIAHQLLDSYRRSKSASLSSQKKYPVFWPEILETVITEKRLQYRDRSSILFEESIDWAAGSFFVSCDRSELARVLSNILNNSVEAIAKKGKIIVRAVGSSERLHLSISDDGCGIPQDWLKGLGKRGQTFGKMQGSGLGLHHAMNTISTWGGTVDIASELNAGTQITLTLPAVKAPSWFLSYLNLEGISSVCIFDDDQSIHELWKQRCPSNRYQVISCFTEEHFFAAVSNGSTRSAFFLVDYRLDGTKKTGLDFITEHQLISHSAIVTSGHYLDEISEECVKLGIPAIPKSFVRSIEIKEGSNVIRGSTSLE